MRLLSGLTRGRKAIAASVVIAITAGIPVTFAVLHRGFPVTDVDLQSKDVWVTNGSLQLAGRLNRQIEELDGSAQATSKSIDVVQNGDDVFLLNRTRTTLERVDPAYTTLGQRADVPKDAEIVLGGDTLAIVDPSNGRLWTTSALGALKFDPSTQKPDLRLGAGGHATVSAGGVVTATSPERKKLYTIDRVGALPHSVDMAIPTDNQVSVIGEKAVVLDVKGSRLLVAGGPTIELGHAAVALQQPGAENSFAVVAGRDRVMEVPLGGGDVTSVDARIPDSADGNGAIAPVYLDGCVHAAWADSQRYLLACAGKDAVRATIEQKTAGDELAFRMNGHVIALNNLDTGNVWLLSDKLRLVDNWDDITPPKEKESQEVSKEKSSVQSFEDTLVKRTSQNHAPTANADTLGVRPGRTTILSVLDNDTDPDGDVLVITNYTPLPESIGRLDPIDGSRALQFTPAEGAAGSASFRYTVSDGRPAGTAETTVDVRVVPQDQNSAPVPQPKANAAVSVESGQSITYNVIRDFIDPDGDDIFLAGAEPTSSDQVRWAPDGTVTFQHTSGEVGQKEVKLTVSDGRATAEGVLKVDVKPAGTLNPVGTPDFAEGFTGDVVQVEPLQNDLSPSGAQLRLLGVKDAPASATVTPNLDKGTVSVSSETPGAVYFEYSLGAGPSTSIGLIRVDFSRPPDKLQPPVAVKDTAFLRQGQSTEVRVLDNDVSPSGSVLAVQSVDVGSSNPSLKVEILNNTIIRISSSAPLTTQSQFTYTVSDGHGSAKAGVTIVPVPPIVQRQPPVAVDDSATVRAGDFTSVHVLDNDYHPDQEALILSPDLVNTDGAGAGGVVFASGDDVRYQAPQEPGQYSAVYRVHDQFGESATATVRFTVTARDVKSDRAPVPTTQTARVFSGAKVDIDIPLDGIDPDGDSVSLVGYTSPPTLGRIRTSASDHFTYEAYPTSAGTDTFRYAVQDTFGKTAIGTVQIGVIPRPEEVAPPNAVDDNVQVKPGKTIAVQPLANDSDPNSYQLSLQKKLLEVDKALTAKVEGSVVVIDAPKREQTYSVRYQISNGHGGIADAFILVRVTKDAPTLYPTAKDYYVQSEQLKKRSDYAVDVSNLVFNPNGESSDLDVTVEGPNKKLASATGTRVTVQAQDQRVAVAYRVTDRKNPGLSGRAFIVMPPRVEGDYFPPPRLRDGLPEQVVPMNSEKTWDLADILTVPSGRPAILTDVNTVSANGSDGSKLWVDGNTIRFAGAKGFRGQTAIVFEVTDGDSADDPTGRTALITMPLTVGNPDMSDVAPAFTTVTQPIQAGEAATSVDLRALTSHPNRGVSDQFGYRSIKGATDRIKASLSGGTLSLSAIQGTPVGTKTDITFEVTYRDFVVPGTVHVVTVPSTRPRAQANLDQVKAQRAKPITTNVLTNDYNPFADQGTPLKLISAVVDNGAQSAASATPSTDGTVAVRPGSSFVGIVSITYTVRDATDDKSRDVQGRLLVDVRDRPDQMQPPTIVAEGDKQVQIAWRTPATNGEPILDYTVTYTGGQPKTFPASAAGATITGLTNGSKYQFQVSARNLLGDSDRSGSSDVAIPYGQPFPPSSATIRQTGDGNGTMELNWGEANGNGRPVDHYYYSLNGAAPVDAGTARSATVRGKVGTTYSFTVYAHALGGNSGTTKSGTTVPQPDGPPKVTATGSSNGSGDVRITWSGGRSTEPITYDVSINGNLWKNNVAAGSATYNGAAEGTYNVKVTATSAGQPVPGSASDTAVNSRPDPGGNITGRSQSTYGGSQCTSYDCRQAVFKVHDVPAGDYRVTLVVGGDALTVKTIHLSGDDGGVTSGFLGTRSKSDDIYVHFDGPKNFNSTHIDGEQWNRLPIQ